MFLARHPFIDNWGWDYAYAACYLLLIILTIVSSLSLTTTAYQVRRKALDRLRALLAEAQGQRDSEANVAQIESTISEIETMTEGAFGRLQEAPLLSGILLPSSGLAVIQLLKAFLESSP